MSKRFKKDEPSKGRYRATLREIKLKDLCFKQCFQPPTGKGRYMEDLYYALPEEIPKGSTYLTMGPEFDGKISPITKSTGKTLVFLDMGDGWNGKLEDLPPNLRYLILGNRFRGELNNLPLSLEFVAVGNDYVAVLPDLRPYTNMKGLALGNEFDAPLGAISEEGLAREPTFRKNWGRLPPGLVHLYIGHAFDHDVNKDNLPRTLQHLTLGNNFNQRIDDLVGVNLTHLDLGDDFNQSVDNLPDTLKVLRVGSGFNRSVDSLPPHLEEFSVLGVKQGHPFGVTLGTFFPGDTEFNQPIDKLPNSIMLLNLGSAFTGSLEVIPKSLVVLWLPAIKSPRAYEPLPGEEDLPSHVRVERNKA